MTAKEIQITDRPTGHILTNTNVWSPDGRWIVYDTRSDPAGEKFDGDTVEIVNFETREVREVYSAKNGAHCGVATFSPTENKVAFILGPEHPTDDWQYSAWHRQGVMVHIDKPGHVAQPLSPAPHPGAGPGRGVLNLDARDITPPFTPGALRGGSHVHVFDNAGEWVSFTYEDHVLASLDISPGNIPHDTNQRNIGISVPGPSVRVSTDHPRNHDGSAFSVLVTRTLNNPRPGSDEISRAFEEAWIGTHGYVRTDGTRQRRALAFQGHVITSSGVTISEVFVVDLPDNVTVPGDAPLEGTSTTRPAPPRGTQQRRLTYTAGRKYPGLQGPRHWLRSSPDGTKIAFLMRDDAGIVQLWTISPNGGQPHQLTHNPFDIASSFTWSPNGKSIAYVADNSIFVTDVPGGSSTRLTPRGEDSAAPRPEACVFSPDGKRIAYVRPIVRDDHVYNQVFVVTDW
jgi:WD40 repeat protein